MRTIVQQVQESEPGRQDLLVYLGREEMFENMGLLDLSSNILQPVIQAEWLSGPSSGLPAGNPLTYQEFLQHLGHCPAVLVLSIGVPT